MYIVQCTRIISLQKYIKSIKSELKSTLYNNHKKCTLYIVQYTPQREITGNYYYILSCLLDPFSHFYYLLSEFCRMRSNFLPNHAFLRRSRKKALVGLLYWIWSDFTFQSYFNMTYRSCALSAEFIKEKLY